MEPFPLPTHLVTATPASISGSWIVPLAIAALALVAILDGYSAFHYTSGKQ